MNQASKLFSAAFLALLVGCVVIPDTFTADISIDIRHINAQADEVLDYVEGKSDVLPGLGGSEDDQTSWLDTTIDFLMPMKTVDAAEIKDTSPRVKQIAQAMKGRYGDVAAAKQSGAIGENNRGFLELVDAAALPNEEAKNSTQRLIAAENDDRKALYKEVARINSEQNLTVSTVEAVYAQKRLERAKPGEKFELPTAGGNFDAFKSSPNGAKLGGAATPGAWVTIK